MHQKSTLTMHSENDAPHELDSTLKKLNLQMMSFDDKKRSEIGLTP